MELEVLLKGIQKPSCECYKQARDHWNHLAKPLYGLGRMEEILCQIAAIKGKAETIEVDPQALLIFCGDHGVVKENVSQTGQEVTALVADNIAQGRACSTLMANAMNIDVFGLDVGVARPTKLPAFKVGSGTKNMTKEWAMSIDEAKASLEAGRNLVAQKVKEGYQLFALGEMGIGNTTSATAILCALLACSPKDVVGVGAGLSSEGLKRKEKAIVEALERHGGSRQTPLQVLAAYGGYEIGAMTGAFLGCAYERKPVIIDGYLGAVAALLATCICQEVRGYLIPSHCSTEPGMVLAMEELKLHPILHGQMHLGEGTGAIMMMPLLKMASEVYNKMDTFEQAKIDAYKEFQKES